MRLCEIDLVSHFVILLLKPTLEVKPLPPPPTTNACWIWQGSPSTVLPWVAIYSAVSLFQFFWSYSLIRKYLEELGRYVLHKAYFENHYKLG